MAVFEARGAASVALVAGFGFGGAQLLEQVVHGTRAGGGFWHVRVGRGERVLRFCCFAFYGDLVAAKRLFEVDVLFSGFLFLCIVSNDYTFQRLIGMAGDNKEKLTLHSMTKFANFAKKSLRAASSVGSSP